MIILFSRISDKRIRIIAGLSTLVFGIYLFQLNQVVWNTILKDTFSFIVAMPLVPGLLLVFTFSLVIFASGMCTELLRARLAKLMKCEETLCVYDFAS